MRQKVERWLLGVWYEDAGGGWVLRPLSWLFRGITRLRNLTYRAGLRKHYRATVPVIVVGNITAGGVGKTPFVVWLVETLQQKGFTPGVITRGYGGTIADATVVNDTHTARDVGDEALMLSRRLTVPVIAGADRTASAALLERKGIDVIVADDGLQHYALARDVEICVVDELRQFGNRRLLPAGPLREPVSRLDTVDVIVYHRQTLAPGQSGMTLANPRLRRLTDGAVLPLGSLAERDVHAVAGVGNPARFFESLRQEGLSITAHPFADHHEFTRSDIEYDDQRPVLMTEKDAVKCDAWARPNMYAVVVDAVVSGDIERSILDTLAQQASQTE